MKIGSSEWEKTLREGALNFGIDLNDCQIDQLNSHTLEMLKWNKKTNLTAITDPHEIVLKHLTDSMAPCRHIPDNSTLLDIGSGGGFPGLTLKIVMPSLNIKLIDASRKKISFLKHVIRLLKLDVITAQHIRAEDLAKVPQESNQFDVVVSRAFSRLDHFIQLALPFLKKNGCIIAMKGPNVEKEINTIEKGQINSNGCNSEKIKGYNLELIEYTLPYLPDKRALVMIRKGIIP